MTDLSKRVLVAHASAHGSTSEIAERIAARLRAVVDVDVRPVVPDLDLDRFDAFVIGSAVHDMAWLPSARSLAERIARTSDGRPVWLFSVAGIDPHGRIRRWMARQEIARVAQGLPHELRPRDHRLFGGVVRMDGVPLWGRMFYLLARQRPGDHRHWAAIEAWADDVAQALSPSASDTGSRSHEHTATRPRSAAPRR